MTSVTTGSAQLENGFSTHYCPRSPTSYTTIVYAPDAEEEREERKEEEDECQEFPCKQLPNADDEEQDENIPLSLNAA